MFYRRLSAFGVSSSMVRSLLVPRRFQSSEADASFAHINRNVMWGLWNEGNLFSLSVPELSYYLRVHCGVEKDHNHVPLTEDNFTILKKSALVRMVEELLSAEQQAECITKQEDTMDSINRSLVISDYDRVEESLDEADEYGDWGAEPGFEHSDSPRRRSVDFMEISPGRMGEAYDPLVCRAYQLLHENITADVKVRKLTDYSKLPGQKANFDARKDFYSIQKVSPYEANRSRFSAALEWCLLNLWNINMPAELNIGAGKVLFYRGVAKQNKNVLPIWTLQKHIHGQHPYVWFAVANETNKLESVENSLVKKLNLTLTEDYTTTYRLTVRRMAETYDLVLNESLQCLTVQRPWDRFLVSHYVRAKMPDLRYLVRARHPIKKRIADLYLETEILRRTRDSVQSVLIPELGDVVYCCERQTRKWTTRTPKTNTLITLVETRRTPLIITRLGDEGSRLEYEWIVTLPEKAEQVDVQTFCHELWEMGSLLADSLTDGMEEFLAHTMSASSIF
ncbi:hypothetical protein, conserved [Angomonas deanei]|uniref:RESC1/2 CYTH-like domain-containing protein n=1 Tax=Angomonas deanei TaxID=59799 RepID=A0A7G2CSP6_9TRYP|nr:hypothetical protein, conserved [Angomonas deanei]